VVVAFVGSQKKAKSKMAYIKSVAFFERADHDKMYPPREKQRERMM
jgi:hypothetical protein